MSPQDKGVPTSPLGRKPIQTGTPEEDRSLRFGTSRELQETKGFPPMALPSFFLKRNTCFPREKQIQEFSSPLASALGLPEVFAKLGCAGQAGGRTMSPLSFTFTFALPEMTEEPGRSQLHLSLLSLSAAGHWLLLAVLPVYKPCSPRPQDGHPGDLQVTG